jgi:hypothetical protein
MGQWLSTLHPVDPSNPPPPPPPVPKLIPLPKDRTVIFVGILAGATSIVTPLLDAIDKELNPDHRQKKYELLRCSRENHFISPYESHHGLIIFSPRDARRIEWDGEVQENWMMCLMRGRGSARNIVRFLPPHF